MSKKESDLRAEMLDLARKTYLEVGQVFYPDMLIGYILKLSFEDKIKCFHAIEDLLFEGVLVEEDGKVYLTEEGKELLY